MHGPMTTSGGRAARVVAQAKVNLALRVLAREASGYHQLETVFQRLELGDVVTLHVTDGERTLDVAGADVGPVERNLAWRAALAYRERAGWPRGWRIELEKRVPVGGGLGGGSADAGAVLRLLDRLNPAPLGARALLELAAGLGADVPFLTTEAPLALAWGRGERMLALPPLPRRPVALWLHPFGVSTAEAFGWLATARDAGSAVPRPALLDPVVLTSWAGVAAVAANDLEGPVFARLPELARGLERLTAAAGDGGAIPVLARMTGTGSTLFALPIPEAERWVPPAPGAGGHGAVLQATNSAVRVEQPELIE